MTRKKFLAAVLASLTMFVAPHATEAVSKDATKITAQANASW